MKRYLDKINPLVLFRDAKIFNRVHSPGEFASILHRERDRADRTGQEFSMAVFEVGNGSRKTHAARNLVPILTHRIRSTDAIGWLADGRIGAVLPHTRPERAWKFVANIRKAGVEPGCVKQLFLTHCHYDHTGGAAALRQQTGAVIVAHELDAEYLEAGDSRVTAASWYGAWIEPLRVDVKVAGSEQRFTVGKLEVTFRHAPGHSPGSAVLYLESDGKRVLFGQDVHGPLHDELRSVRADYVKSLEFLLSLEADILCEGHFGVVIGKQKVRDFIESYL